MRCMDSKWFQQVGSVVPRGFSRYYILELLKEAPRSGKEIIDNATTQSKGVWKPSSGLIYPLLGRLLDEELIEESIDGKYALTSKGREMSQDVDKIEEIVRRQLDVLFRLGGIGRFVAMDLLERISAMGAIIGENIENMTEAETEKYRQFLKSELGKIQDTTRGKKIEID